MGYLSMWVPGFSCLHRTKRKKTLQDHRYENSVKYNAMPKWWGWEEN